ANPRVVFANGAQTAAIVMAAVLDANTTPVEPNETVNIGVGTPTAITGLSGGVAAPTDSAPQFSIVNRSQITLASFAQSAYTATEAAGAGRTVTVTVDYTPSALVALTIPITVTGTAVAGSGKDYTRTGGASITTAVGDTSSTITVTIADDVFDDDAETIIITLSDGANWDLGANSSTTITITDDDAQPEVTLSASPATVAEFAGATTVTVTGTMQGTTRFEQNTSLTVGIAGSGGANVVDFTAPSSVTLPIAAGAVSGTADFTLTPTDDSTVESDETITLSATEAGAVVNSGTIAVTDDDSSASLSLTLSAAAGDVAEGASGAAGYKDVTVTLGSALTGSQTVTVPLTVTGVTVATDYTLALQPATQAGVTLLTSGAHSAQNPAVRLAAGATSAVLRFTPVDNSVRTNPAVVIAYGTGSRLPSGTGVSLGTPAGSPVVFAVADDETGAIEVEGNWALKPSGVGPGQQFRLLFVTSGTRDASSSAIADYDAFVRAAAAQGHAATVPYAGLFKVLGSTAAVDASAHAGFSGSDAVEVFWLGDTAAADRVTASYPGLRGEWQNQAAPHDETGSAASVNASGYFTGSTSTGAKSASPLGSTAVSLGYLADSGSGRAPLGSGTTAANTATRPFYGLSPVFTATGVAQFAMAAASAGEDAGTVNVTVDISPAAAAPITVGYTLSGTATRGSDYSIAGVTGSSGTVTIPSGATSVSIPVAITDDAAEEGAETIILTLADGDGYTVGTNTEHTLTIGASDQASVAANADGSYTVPGDWALLPAGLQTVGQKFRLMFRTTSRWAATSTDIATYDGYVQGEAAGGSLAAILPYASQFKVVGSTNSVDIRTHLDLRDGSNWRTGIP
ncbi:MAG: hypothetical protein OXG09_07780, partial [Chloroflexi bacterium]|nr:hypothetical protein [Chloroflexota bacterium]